MSLNELDFIYMYVWCSVYNYIMINSLSLSNLICQSFLIRFHPTSLTAMFISIMQILSLTSLFCTYFSLHPTLLPLPSAKYVAKASSPLQCECARVLEHSRADVRAILYANWIPTYSGCKS